MDRIGALKGLCERAKLYEEKKEKRKTFKHKLLKFFGFGCDKIGHSYMFISSEISKISPGTDTLKRCSICGDEKMFFTEW